ncbi:hypothetical protein CKAH01_18000 [Colletotrichum kahawae]|uniref:Uncharacterized protein n=1 Tax=Colletotrichum kahawae TaxID=34407 RepID=A0AAD9Y9H8_COLKA|nr:hypothetical protein CKAH01_18000 [Colletotrichum kahawae]
MTGIMTITIVNVLVWTQEHGNDNDNDDEMPRRSARQSACDCRKWLGHKLRPSLGLAMHGEDNPAPNFATPYDFLNVVFDTHSARAGFWNLVL